MRSSISAQFATGKLPLWSPNQAPTVVCCVCVGIAGIEQDNVTVDTPMLGGGFGRRGEVEFSVHATLIAMQADGQPVKVIWTHEEDMTHDTYRPAAMARFKALSAEGLHQPLDGVIATRL